MLAKTLKQPRPQNVQHIPSARMIKAIAEGVTSSRDHDGIHLWATAALRH